MEPPVPIPNTEVKRPSADDTEGATPCGKYATARRLFDLCVELLYTLNSDNSYRIGSPEEKNGQQV